MAVVSVRVEDQVLDALKEHGVNVSEVARRALGAEAKRLTALQAVRRLARLRLPVEGPPTEEIIRRLRDDRRPRP